MWWLVMCQGPEGSEVKQTGLSIDTDGETPDRYITFLSLGFLVMFSGDSYTSAPQGYLKD